MHLYEVNLAAMSPAATVSIEASDVGASLLDLRRARFVDRQLADHS